MSGSAIVGLLALAGLAVVFLFWLAPRRSRSRVIDTVDLMRLDDLRRMREAGRQRHVRWTIVAVAAIVLASLFRVFSR